jgi:SAM-dependent methyltransferase
MIISPLVPKIVAIVLTIAAVMILVGQCRKPWSLPGLLFIWLMNRRHFGVTQWGLRHVNISPGANILDVGCGGGRTIRTLAGMGRMVYGVDYSATSVAAAARTNADLIAAGRVDIRQAGVSRLPFGDACFDLVTAVETHYYWPDPIHDFQEVLRVIKPGGTLLVIAETYRNQTFAALLILPMLLLRARYLTLDEHRALLSASGFTDVEIEHDSRKGWICGIARRPAAWQKHAADAAQRRG